ncbi:hypothetical protein B0T09DRAFT_332563 [Sordaria sp. MPI-SDFR-AT-0083]|nr:hypothetical protein B0T09DRAFT_332563 [Sordaria sp. MPI-SDFR-AT-0083]
MPLILLSFVPIGDSTYTTIIYTSRPIPVSHRTHPVTEEMLCIYGTLSHLCTTKSKKSNGLRQSPILTSALNER